MSSTANEFSRETTTLKKGQAKSSGSAWKVVKNVLHPLPGLSSIGVLALFLGMVAIFAVILTYMTLSGITPFSINRDVLINLLLLNLLIVAAITPIILWRVTRLWSDRRKGATASKLHMRLVVLFSVIAIIPAIIVAVFSAITLTFSLNSLLDEPVPTAMENSATMANYYLEDQTKRIGTELRAMAIDVNTNARLFIESPIQFGQILEFQIKARGLTSAYLISDSGVIMAKAERENAPVYSIPDEQMMKTAREGTLTIFSDMVNSQFRGVLKLPAFKDSYLLVARRSDPKVWDHLVQMRIFRENYARIAENRAFLELVFAATYIVIALMVLLGAIWMGLRAATNVVSPVGRLMLAAEKVSDGDLSARVRVNDKDDEIGKLSETFNRMTGQIETQRNELIAANEQMDQRRRFTEAVLGGVSAGVLGVDHHGKISIANRSALKLMNVSQRDIIGKDLSILSPELDGLFKKALLEKGTVVNEYLHLTISNQTRHFNVQVTEDEGEGEDSSFVITIDDVTKLVSAQRTAAWADVARRIAHEIKNPLTPIQLSAERLRRKYTDEIESDPHIFEQCTDTIVRQVKDIGRMVDEFSSFARMPMPVIRDEELVDLVKRSVFSQRVANPDIEYEINLPDRDVLVQCDGRLIAQALTNILKNAAEGIETKLTALRENNEKDFMGAIDVAMSVDQGRVTLTIEDNGCGLPQEQRERLTEPYMTTRAKGTGLGLAIVKKILEDHGGELILGDSSELSGASIKLILPQAMDASREENTEETESKPEVSHAKV